MSPGSRLSCFCASLLIYVDSVTNPARYVFVHRFAGIQGHGGITSPMNFGVCFTGYLHEEVWVERWLMIMAK